MVQQQSSKQQLRLNYHISGTPIAQGPKLRPNGPLHKAIVPTKFGPPTSRVAPVDGRVSLENGPDWGYAVWSSNKQQQATAGGP